MKNACNISHSPSDIFKVLSLPHKTLQNTRSPKYMIIKNHCNSGIFISSLIKDYSVTVAGFCLQLTRKTSHKWKQSPFSTQTNRSHLTLGNNLCQIGSVFRITIISGIITTFLIGRILFVVDDFWWRSGGWDALTYPTIETHNVAFACDPLCEAVFLIL